MQRVTLAEAQNQLPELVEAAVQGETVLIVVQGERVIQLMPISVSKQPRKPGSAAGQIRMSEDFDAPLDDFKDYMP